MGSEVQMAKRHGRGGSLPMQGLLCDNLWLTWWMTTLSRTYLQHRGSEFRKASKHSDVCDICCEGNKVRQRLGEFIAANKEHITSNHWTEHPPRLPSCQPGRRVDSDGCEKCPATHARGACRSGNTTTTNPGNSERCSRSTWQLLFWGLLS